MKTWSRKQVAEITGIPERRVLFYTEQQILPGFNIATGRGNSREYSLDDIFCLAVANEITASGVGLSKVKPMMTTIYGKFLNGSIGVNVQLSESVKLTIKFDKILDSLKAL